MLMIHLSQPLIIIMLQIGGDMLEHVLSKISGRERDSKLLIFHNQLVFIDGMNLKYQTGGRNSMRNL